MIFLLVVHQDQVVPLHRHQGLLAVHHDQVQAAHRAHPVFLHHQAARRQARLVVHQVLVVLYRAVAHLKVPVRAAVQVHLRVVVLQAQAHLLLVVHRVRVHQGQVLPVLPVRVPLQDRQVVHPQARHQFHQVVAL